MKPLAFGLSVFTCVLLGGCHRHAAKSDDAGRPRIALVVKTLNSPFFQDMKRGAELAAQGAGVELILQAPERELDAEKQMAIVENLIQTRVSLLCLVPSGSKELVPVVGKANKAHIPVIIVDTRLDEATVQADHAAYVTFIGSDNYEGGKLAGQHLARQFSGPASVAVLEGIPGHETADNRLRGFRDGLAGRPSIKIVASQPANWERDQGFNVTQNLLRAHPQLEAVFACNDMMALGALEAIRSAGAAGKVKLLGFDAVDEARQAIAAHQMEASIAQHPEEMGRLAIETAVRVLKGETIPRYIPVKIELITAQNAGAARDRPSRPPAVAPTPN